ncbi:hypothetical protein CLF_100898, partial [Clonorchis sinensis]
MDHTHTHTQTHTQTASLSTDVPKSVSIALQKKVDVGPMAPVLLLNLFCESAVSKIIVTTCTVFSGTPSIKSLLFVCIRTPHYSDNGKKNRQAFALSTV